MRARRLRTASPDSITCGLASTRISSVATRRCRVGSSPVAPDGTLTDSPWRCKSKSNLGSRGKEEIEERVGIADFTRLCRESVLSYVDEFERLTERIGYWIDTEHAYYTYHPSYVESVWWHLKQLFDRGLLYEDFKVVPYCQRCETGLSSHELGQPGVYTDETDESVYVKFPLTDAHTRTDLGGATHLAVWTTTPWTLISNVAVAVNPEVTYAVVDGA